MYPQTPAGGGEAADHERDAKESEQRTANAMRFQANGMGGIPFISSPDEVASGGKSVGEASTNGCPPAIVNGVVDRLHAAGLTPLDKPYTARKPRVGLQSTYGGRMLLCCGGALACAARSSRRARTGSQTGCLASEDGVRGANRPERARPSPAPSVLRRLDLVQARFAHPNPLALQFAERRETHLIFG